MLQKIKISTKITLLVIFIVLISTVSVSFIAYQLSESSIEERYLESVNVIAKLKSQKIDIFLDKLKENLRFSSNLKAVREKLQKELLINNDNNNITLKKDSLQKQNDTTQNNIETNNIIYKNDNEVYDLLKALQSNFYQIKNIYLTDKEGKIIFKTDKNTDLSARKIKDYYLNEEGDPITSAGDSIIFTGVYNSQNKKEKYFSIYAPVIDKTRQILGLIVYEVTMDYIYEIASDTLGLGKTGEILLIKRYGNKITYLNPLKEDKDAALKKYAVVGESEFLDKAVRGYGYETYTTGTDYRGEQVLATWRFIPEVNWGVIVKVDNNEIYAPSYRLRNVFFIAGAVVIIISVIIGVIFSRILIEPLQSLKDTIELLSQGVLPKELEQSTADEFGEMSQLLNELVTNLKNTAEFAHKIGEGDFNAQFHPSSENDALAIALLTMRNSIQQAAKKDEERNWIVVGRAEIGDILRERNNIESLGEAVVEYICRKINAVQGAFYTLNSIEQDAQDVLIEMNASYAYNKRKYIKAQFRFAEGLIGQAVAEQDTILRTEIPDEYITITSGLLGDRKPTALLITPLITLVDREEKVLGVLEFAGFEKFSSRDVRFVEEVSEIIARTVFNIKVQERTQKLLDESQEMSRSLQYQQQILTQNAEEMESTQETLKLTNIRLEAEVEKVQIANAKTAILLENSSEIITIYKETGEIREISPSVEKILGYTVEDMIGIQDLKYMNAEGQQAFKTMFATLIAEPYKKVTIQINYKSKIAGRVWLEATGTNLLNDPAIQGIVVNSRDITERRLAEKEARMRGQMQALSENSPDLITRLSTDGTIFYINPTIERLTNIRKEEYIRKRIDDIILDGRIIKRWKEIIDDIVEKKEKVSLEMDFPITDKEKHIMQVNAIPEYSETQAIESILLVSHDITERKLIELAVQQTNRRITESINYAKRIQEAILPSASFLKNYLPDSFILYKPRDVVSGDFPWFFKKDDDIYLAAVDCTGHGVPGALISIIGFFTINNVLNSGKAIHPSDVLNLLDVEMAKTLKQDSPEAVTKDGMDIALCKINLQENTLEYAGAHRPMFFFKNNGTEIEEVKGDKMPVGGGGEHYKKKDGFTNHIIQIEKGDSFYISSDGYGDQFGGADNKKFSPRKMREVILDGIKKGKFDQMHNILDDAFESWKGETKQTDDILVIGAKF
ncbi:MAG: PAS domain S-box protein [Cytophagales bacterium]|nr:MAG: PAS domain S-box protein [Cytophagales bacterium]